MTVVNFSIENGVLNGFSVKGHSSQSCDDFEGKIVCAAVSSAAYMTANTIIEVIKQPCDVSVDEAEMVLKVNKPNSDTVTVLKGFYIHMEQLSQQYKNNIKLISEV